MATNPFGDYLQQQAVNEQKNYDNNQPIPTPPAVPVKQTATYDAIKCGEVVG